MNDVVGRRPDVIVVGGGVIGCFAAYYLVRRGYRVTIVERKTIGSGASGGNCGYVCPSHVMPLCGPGAIRHALPQVLSRKGALSIPARIDPALWRWLAQFAVNCTAAKQASAAIARHALLHTSMQLYRDFLAETDLQCGWEERGLLIVHRSPTTLDAFESVAQRLDHEFGVRPDRLGPAELLTLEPSLKEGLAGGYHFAADTHLDPATLMTAMRQHLIDSGVTVLESTTTHRIEVVDGVVRSIETSQGKMTADVIVVATGAEAPAFAKPLGCVLPIVPGKGYSMTYRSMPAEMRVTVPMIFEDTHVAVTPFGDTLRIGSTMQLTGYDASLDANRMRMIRDDARLYLRTNIPDTPDATWCGWRPMVADDVPCIDRSPAAANAFVAAGNGMVGLSTAPATGQLIADLVSGQTPSIDPAPYSLDRFLKSPTRRSISPSPST